MSLEALFTTVRSVTSSNAAFQRRLRLLEIVLPSFMKAASLTCCNTKRFSPTRAFWTGCLTSFCAMDMAGWRFDKLDHRHDELLKQSLKYLELAVDMDKTCIAEEFTSSPYPRMETLRKLIKTGEIDAEDLLVSSEAKFVKPDTSQLCAILLNTLSELSKVMEDTSKQPDPEETELSTGFKPVLAPLLSTLFSTMSDYLKCKCIKPHKAILYLFTHQSSHNAGSYSFKMLMNRGKSDGHWKKTIVTMKEQIPESRVRIVFPGSVRSVQKGQVGQSKSLVPVSNLCRTISSTDTSRLYLNVEGVTLFERLETDDKKKGIEDGEPVSLAEGFFGNATELNIQGKTCLALVLSYSLLDFCGEPWFPAGWTKNGICFLQTGDQLSLRPILVTSIRPNAKGAPSSTVSTDLKLLFHGILMMEIFQQEVISIKLGAGKNIDLENLRSLARIEFEAVDWDVYERYRQAVEACIEGAYGAKLETSEDPEDSFAKQFCQRVIGPLKIDFASHWGSQDPDEVISTLKMPSVKRKEPPRPAPKPIQFKLRQLSVPTVQFIHAPAKFFDAVDGPDARQIQGAKRWFDLFDQTHIQDKLPKRAKAKNDRIRIAILDTGIDLRNPWIGQKLGRIQCWPTKEACEDTDGHGTQVAYLLLRLAPHAQLRIAKVARSQTLEDRDIENIANAIRHFSSGEEEDRVNIINLSFGFPQYIEKLRPILDAIRAARERNVLVFAAAGNEGGNQGIFWPAKLYQAGDVICVNSSDSEGNASGFNPTIGTGNRICTLGEAVPSCERDEQQQVVYRSGTSFATPIAVAIAAIVLGFVDGAHALYEPDELPDDFATLKRKLHTKSGMERILHNLCVLPDEKRRAGFSYITPWFFLDIQERSRAHIVANELRSIPE